MKKKGYIVIITAALISLIYIFSIEYISHVPAKFVWLNERLGMTGQVVPAKERTREAMKKTDSSPLQEEISLEEAGITLTGIVYGEQLEEKDLMVRAGQMAQALSHGADCSLICTSSHSQYARAKTEALENGNQVFIEGENEDCSYEVILKNQKDRHYNSYYKIRITGRKNMKLLDNMAAHGEKLLKKWKAEPEQALYLKGNCKGRKDYKTWAETGIFKPLKAVQTNYYENEVQPDTCSYYGYSPYIKTAYKEANGTKTNIQAAFSYDETKDRTQVIIGCPFYNDPF